MNSLTITKYFFKPGLLSSLAALGLLFFGSLQIAHAQLVTFGQFVERNGTQDFVFTNNTTNASFNTVGGGSAVFFFYSNISGLDPSLSAPQLARLFLSSNTAQPASLIGANVNQPFTSGVDTIQIIRDTPAPVGVGTGSRRNLLTVTYLPNTSPPALAGTDGGNSASFSVTTPDHIVTFTSDFVNFSTSTQRNFGVSFSSVVPNLTIGPGSFLASFNAAGTGTFASDPPPTTIVPTAASVIIGGRVLTSAGRGLPNAQVSLTTADGSTRSVLTSAFGYYNLTDVQAGQTVVVSVRSKRYTFTSQIVNVDDNLTDLNLIAEP